MNLEQSGVTYVYRISGKMSGNLDIAESREWLVTNGIGGYASGTVAGLLTRRYHGLLVAASKPPLGRTLMLTKKLDETVLYGVSAADQEARSLFSRH
ncbi:glycogen debranching enzyme N-terminal domain-containing protein [Nostoc sp.]